MTALWSLLVIFVGLFEYKTHGKYTSFFESHVALDESKRSVGAVVSKPSVAASEVSLQAAVNPDDYFGPIRVWAFDMDKFLTALLLPVIGFWILVTVLVPAVGWVVRGFRA